MLVVKIIFLFIAVFFTVINVTGAWQKSSLPTVNFVMQTVGIVGFVVCQWLI